MRTRSQPTTCSRSFIDGKICFIRLPKTDAIAKLERGQFIMIRDGTAARNLEALAPLLCDKYAERCMFCTDDKHPSDLLEKGHIDFNVRRPSARAWTPSWR